MQAYSRGERLSDIPLYVQRISRMLTTRDVGEVRRPQDPKAELFLFGKQKAKSEASDTPSKQYFDAT